MSNMQTLIVRAVLNTWLSRQKIGKHIFRRQTFNNTKTVQISQYLKLLSQKCRRLAGHKNVHPRDSSASDPIRTSLHPQKPKIMKKTISLPVKQY